MKIGVRRWHEDIKVTVSEWCIWYSKMSRQIIGDSVNGCMMYKVR